MSDDLIRRLRSCVTMTHETALMNEAADELERLGEALQEKRETLQRASGWLHAAYDKPTITPECQVMLSEVDAARDLGS